MATLQNILGEDSFELFEKAKFLSEEESKRDPENEPYKSKYRAQEIYEELNNLVKDRLASTSTSTTTNNNGTENQNVTFSKCSQRSLLALSLCLDHLVGLCYMDTEELSAGEDRLTSCLKRIDDNELHEVLSLQINIQNQLGILWTQRGDLEKSMQYLELADKQYHVHKQNEGNAPMALMEQLEPYEGSEDDISRKRSRSFESIHTHTLYYLAQVYAKQEKSDLSAQYCHMTLHRQLQAGEFNPVDWGLNAVTLSQYYLGTEKFKESRHCLASGTHIFMTSRKSVEELSEEEKEMQYQRAADIERCWIKYGLALLEESQDEMLQEIERRDEDGESVSISQDKDHNSDKKKVKSCTSEMTMEERQENPEKCFDEFELELTSYEEKVTDKLVRTLDGARKIFLFTIEKINDAMKFYTLDSHASDAIEIIQDHSKAYKLLAFFELDMNRQCKMHKRRVDMLTDVLKELNPQYYLLVQRQLMFEIADTYSTMVDLKVTLIEMELTRATSYSSQKINKLISQSISKYQEYIDSLKGGKPELPPEFPEGNVRPGLVAFFCMGRLYSKFLEAELSRRLAVITKSLECYKFVVEYCSANPSAEDIVKSELDICKEMVELLPLKMQRMREQSTS